jgi:hypothetical protein
MANAKSDLKRREIRRGQNGFAQKIQVIHTVKSRRAEYDFDILYEPDVTDRDIARDSRRLAAMADEQADAMDALDPFLNTTISSGGLSALITSVSVHFENTQKCQLLLTFYINQRQFWVSKTFEAGTPSQLPNSNFLTAFVTTYLNALAAED